MSRVRATCMMSILLVLAAALAGCRGGREVPGAPGGDTGASAAGAPAYLEIAEAYNARAAMLDRVWARCSASFTFEDDQGRRRSEQGEGHLQIVQPGRFALSVGKLGEVLLWVGGDGSRYWLIERIEEKRAFFGRTSELTPEKAARIGLPVYPDEMLRLLGVVPLPTEAHDGIVYRYRDGDLVVSVPASTQAGDGARWYYKLDPTTLEPRAIRLKVGSDVVLESALSDYIRVEKEGVALGPTIARRSLLTHLPSGASMNIQLDESVSDGAGRLNANAFRFEFLVEALGPLEVVDVDETGAQDAP